MLLYIMLYIVLAYLMLFAAVTNSVCLNNASLFLYYFLWKGYELSGEIALTNNHYYYYYYYLMLFVCIMFIILPFTIANAFCFHALSLGY